MVNIFFCTAGFTHGSAGAKAIRKKGAIVFLPLGIAIILGMYGCIISIMLMPDPCVDLLDGYRDRFAAALSAILAFVGSAFGTKMFIVSTPTTTTVKTTTPKANNDVEGNISKTTKRPVSSNATVKIRIAVSLLFIMTFFFVTFCFVPSYWASAIGRSDPVHNKIWSIVLGIMMSFSFFLLFLSIYCCYCGIRLMASGEDARPKVPLLASGDDDGLKVPLLASGDDAGPKGVIRKMGMMAFVPIVIAVVLAAYGFVISIILIPKMIESQDFFWNGNYYCNYCLALLILSVGLACLGSVMGSFKFMKTIDAATDADASSSDLCEQNDNDNTLEHQEGHQQPLKVWIKWLH
eukprot:scaffold25646_cov117-Cylindrotheca_fusiformis.AAC.2